MRPERSSWPDRHPAAAVTAALFTLTLMAMMFSVHPVAAVALTALGALAIAAWLFDRESDRRADTAARADRANRELMQTLSAPRVIRLGPNPPPAPRGDIAGRHVMNRYPTTPMPTRRITR